MRTHSTEVSRFFTWEKRVSLKADRTTAQPVCGAVVRSEHANYDR